MHTEVDYHYVRDGIHDVRITPSYVSTKDQCADILTKALGTQ